MSVCKAELSAQPFSQTLSCEEKSWVNFNVMAPTLPRQLPIQEQSLSLQHDAFKWHVHCENPMSPARGRFGVRLFP